MKHLILMAPAAGALAAALLGPAFAAGAPNGEQLFRQRCAGCHLIAPARQGPLAPSLAGVVGRQAGATGFAYSAQLKQSGLTWTPAELDRFLAAPARAVPGTRMPIGVPNAAERAALIDYLATIR